MEQTDLSIPAVVGALHRYSISTVRALIATRHETEIPEEFCDLSLTYLNNEFPSLWPYVYTTVSNSLAKFFVSFLPDDVRIRDVLWAFEPHLLRIWTVIDEPNFKLEEPIYEAQRRFLDKVDDMACDFTVVYAFGKPIADIRPTGAISIK